MSNQWSNGAFTTSLTYSFIAPNLSFFARNYSDDNEYQASYALTSAQQSAVTNALGTWSSVANVKFTLVGDSITNVGDLRFGGYSDMDSDTAAWGYFPDKTPSAGDVWIGPSTNSPTPVKGSYDYLTFMHEIGHALGLKHPFTPSALNATVLAPEYDDVRYTIMSYGNAYSYEPTTPMLLDIAAIQSLYGANTQWQTGNNTYSWAADQSVFQTIWDAGGNDTIDARNQEAAVRINLNEGQFSKIGKEFMDLGTQTSFNEGLAIAYGAKIENAFGSANDDTLIGNALGNLLNGLGGADLMVGGSGNDTYVVDNVDDLVQENSSLPGEIDSVYSSINYTLGINLEVLTLSGSDNLDGTGNTLNNRITGNAGYNTLDGGSGVDTLIGGAGNDTYVVDNLQDVISETSALASEIDTVRSSGNWSLGANLENLTLTGSAHLDGNGNALNNVLVGNSGSNVLNGGAGLDTLIGGAGNDSYVLDQAGELTLLQEDADQGRDSLNITYTASLLSNVVDLSISNLRNVENVTLSGAGLFTVIGNDLDNNLIGNVYVSTLQGGAGNDYLDGGVSADTLSGGTGNDIYVLDNLGDKVIEAADEGRDLIRTSVSYTLSANVEAGQLLGVTALNLVGNELDNTLTGNSAANVLNGLGGADLMVGGSGNDTYVVDNVDDLVQENSSLPGEIDSVLSSINYILDTNLEILTLTGSDHLDGTGNTLTNRITGNAGNNALDGGSGVDTLIGGSGNDTYVVDNLQDVISETSALASEIDTVRSSVNWNLGANLENLTLTGSAHLNGAGNALNNVLTGNAGNNVLNGGAGLDTLIGGAGDDAYVLDQAGELVLLQEEADQGRDSLTLIYASSSLSNVVDLNTSNLRNVENVTLSGAGLFMVVGNDLNNSLIGNAFVNTLQGGAGNDYLDGGVSADTLSGGTGNDTYVLDNLGDKVIEAADEGRDLIRTSVSYTLSANVEDGQLLGSITALNLVGNDLDNSLIGNSAANVLNGLGGADTLDGGAGNDTYYVDNLGDTVIERGTSLTEIDSVYSSISYTLGANLDILTLSGSDHLDGTGNTLNNRITGNAGNNALDGGSGVDTLIGGSGNDTYVVDNLQDIVSETSILASEIDTVRSSVNWNLGANLENLTLTGSANLNGNGNALNNVLTGNAGNNVLNGGAGLDTLIGGAGDDAYVLDQAGELVLLQEEADQGRDSLTLTYASSSLSNVVDLNTSNLRNVENVILSGAGLFTVVGNDLNNSLIGNAFVNALRGGAGNDYLDGGASADTLSGGTGNDTYILDNLGDKVIEAADEGSDLIRTSVSYTLSANVEDGQLLGVAAVNLVGNDLDNSLIGNSAANVLNGLSGADTLDGGAGNDTYYVDSLGDTLIERGASLTEIDSVLSSINYTLGTNFEALTLRGSDNLDGTGNALNNRITGNAGANTLDGGSGIDTLIGGAGNDTYVVDNLKDIVSETSTLASEIDTVHSSVNWNLGANLENLTLTGSANLNGNGNALNNVLTGNAGNNVLNGGVGLDTLIGGAGDDAYVLDQAGELALLQENADQGRDSLNLTYTASSLSNVVDLNISNLRNVESVILSGAGLFTVVGNDLNNSLIGNAFVNALRGGAGNDYLDGGASADTLSGGTGNDTYILDNLGDKVIEAADEGRDLIRTSVSYTLSANVEDGQLLGVAAVNLVGNDLDNSLTGNSAANVLYGLSGSDTLNGGAGIDTLIGGTGNDTYVVDNLQDIVSETSTLASEIDTVRSSVSWNLGANLENLTLNGSAHLNGAGNALGNELIGNAGNNVLSGGAGNDQLDGGAGNDMLIGGIGTDIFTGGDGADRFVFSALNDLGKDSARDIIFDFSSLQGDKIDLSKLDANILTTLLNKFSFIDSNDFTTAGQLRFVDQVLYGNINGDLDADFEIQLLGVNTFSASDLVA